MRNLQSIYLNKYIKLSKFIIMKWCWLIKFVMEFTLYVSDGFQSVLFQYAENASGNQQHNNNGIIHK